MSYESGKYHRIGEAYARVNERDALRRSPAKVVDDLAFLSPKHRGGSDLDDRINLRGQAADLRDKEVGRASRCDRVIKCYEQTKGALERLETFLNVENESKAATAAWHLLEELEKMAEDAKEELADLREKAKGEYHVGGMYWNDGFGLGTAGHRDTMSHR